jgi:hypothetical protein
MNDSSLKKLEYYINDYYNNYLPNDVSIQEYLDKMNDFELIECKPTLKDISQFPKKEKIIIILGMVLIFILGGIII